MTLQTQMESDLSGFYDLFGLDATYTPSGESGSSIKVIESGQEDYNQDQGIGNRARSLMKKVSAMQSDVASPAYRDTVTIGSDIWTVLNAVSITFGLEWELNLIRDEKPGWNR